MRMLLRRNSSARSNQRHNAGRWLRLCVYALVSVALCAWPVYVASAHANLIHSDPAAGAVVLQAPYEAVMDFKKNGTY